MTQYIVVGGNPFTGYTGTMSYTSLRSLGTFSSKEEAEECREEMWEECGGLIEVFPVEIKKP